MSIIKSNKQLKIAHVAIEELKPATYNPRIWDESALDQLKESISRFGLVDPIIANSAPKRKNIVIGGHMRLEVAKQLGLTEVPVVYLNLPSVDKEKELNIRLNKNTGAWDFEKLKDMDIEVLLDVGFTDDDLSAMWDSVLESEDDEFDVEKEIEQIKKTNIKPGDLYALGPHRLICGSSTDKEVVQKLVGKELMDMIYCDPPYNIGLSYDKGIGGKAKYGGKVKWNFSKKNFENIIF